MSLKEERSADVSPVGNRMTFYLSEIMNHELNAFCTAHRIAPFAVFYMAVAIYLKRTKGIQRFCMGAPVHNRSSFTDRKTTGMFVSTLPFFSRIDESWSFEEFAGYLADDWLELLRHQKLSYAEIFAISKEENPSVHRLYHLVLSFHNSQAYKNHNTSVEFSGQWHYSGYQAEHICIHLNNIEDEKRYSVNYDYLAQLFSRQEIENFHNYLMNILTEAFAWPNRPITQLSFLGAEEKERVLFRFNRTERYVPAFKDICQDDTSLAYLIYTSGSTGKPKGVKISQRSFLNFAAAMGPYYASGAVLSICNTGFDAFLIESMGALLNGRTIVLAGSSDVEDPKALAGLIRDYAAGFLTTTPSRLQAYMKDESFCKALGRIESIVCGGENFPGSLLAGLAFYTDARIYNQYGPSETTVGVTAAMLNRTARITAGRPMDNCRCYILDAYGNPLPTGVFGELYVAGVCVGEGYLHDDERTREAFMNSPFEPGERMYRTGDIACWTGDGQILIRGRQDGQVKIRGQRVELGEISAKLMRHPKIELAAVRLAGEGQAHVLIAYYTSLEDIPEQELMEFASSVLPDYMVPAAYMRVDSIPLNTNGKLDASGLPLPNFMEGGTEPAPESIAGKILEVFRRVLKHPDMPVTGDYFLYGGDSLNGIQVLSELETILGVRLRIADLYSCRNARGLARRLGEERPYEALQPYGVQAMEKAPQLETYPLTPQQMGVYFETMMHPDRCTYNMP